MPIDFKKEQKDLYQPKTTPTIIDVPEMTFIAVDGKGDLDNSGVGDRHVDIFWGLWTFFFNLKTDKYRGRFIDAYGRNKG